MTEVLAIRQEHPDYSLQERLRYDLRTQFAELVDGNMRTEFSLQFDGRGDLIGEDGRGMDAITRDSLYAAKEIAKRNPDLWFEVRRRGEERLEFYEMIAMARGERPNTMIVISDFPEELMDAEEDVGGYNVRRKQAMLRVLARKPDGNIQMYSQTLDGSNRQALEVIYERFGITPEAGELLGQRIPVDLNWTEQTTVVDELTGLYDRNLTIQLGGAWYGGRQPADYENTYDFVCRQHDLIEECVRLQNLGWLSDDAMYKMAATMQKRFMTQAQTPMRTIPIMPNIDPALLYQEIKKATDQAKSSGMLFSACGVTLSAEGMDGSTDGRMELAGYGNKSGEDEYGPLSFTCQKGHPNTRPRHKLIPKCTTCKMSVKC